MAVAHSTKTVGTTATSLLAGVNDANRQPYTSKNETARSVVLTNAGSETVLLGGPGVTSSSYGYALDPAASMTLDLTSTDLIYAVVAANTSTVRMLHLGV
ncbi:hypothetical protein [Micromonospora sp. NPDC049240]|uniref:hypothetical protein n=1 Tax=Micromonospora sp. NPDC049240 TaxID=3155151 RepID=UPI0033DE4993